MLNANVWRPLPVFFPAGCQFVDQVSLSMGIELVLNQLLLRRLLIKSVARHSFQDASRDRQYSLIPRQNNKIGATVFSSFPLDSSPAKNSKELFPRSDMDWIVVLNNISTAVESPWLGLEDDQEGREGGERGLELHLNRRRGGGMFVLQISI